MFTVIWMFEIAAGREAEFDRVYGPEGDWVALFRRDPEYLATELLRDATTPGRRIVIDRWNSAEAYRGFLTQHQEAYDALDRRCEALTDRETLIGEFESSEAGDMPQDAVKDIVRVSEDLAAAIERREVATLRTFLAPGFRHRGQDGATSDAAAFLDGVARIPGQITFVRLERLEVTLTAAGAIAVGVQHAQVQLDGQLIDDRRGFVDWFVRHQGEWRIQAAVDLPNGS